MITFNSLLIIGGVAIAVPLLLGLVPAVKVPAVVLEILGGVLVGPAVLGWVHLDAAVRVTADLGLGFLLFMAGYEIDLRRFERPVLVLVGRAFAVSIALALLVAYGLQLAGQVRDGLLVAITLVSTSLGILVPILKDAGHASSTAGLRVISRPYRVISAHVCGCTQCTQVPPSSRSWPSLRSVQVRPPTRSRASSTSTSSPAWPSSRAATSPANPAPMTTTSASARASPLRGRPSWVVTIGMRLTGGLVS